jgi:predicted glycoside hydrolase/deacetylase ChbG (UPF0249 family)
MENATGARPDLADLKEAERPKAPPIEGVTDLQRRQGRQLAAIHRMHLMQMGQVRKMMQDIASGSVAPAALAQALPEMEMTRNYRQFGTLCGQECQFLDYHHGAEEHRVFPHLEGRGSDGLRAVIDKLRQEHEVVHALLERLYADAVRLVQSPGADAFEEAKATFEALERVVRSHFGYEEDELEEALGVYGGL